MFDKIMKADLTFPSFMSEVCPSFIHNTSFLFIIIFISIVIIIIIFIFIVFIIITIITILIIQRARDVLSRMLVRDPSQRLGSGIGDAQELKEHPYFADVDWDGLYHGRVVSPWTPAVKDSLDTSQFDQEFTDLPPAGECCLLSLVVFL